MPVSRLLCCTLFLSLLWVTTATGATYYVDHAGGDGPGGSDFNSCSQAQSPGSAKETLVDAVTCLQPGDTLYLRGGTWLAGNNFIGLWPLPSGTSWLNPITIAAAPGETVWLAPDGGGYAVRNGERYIIFDRLNVDKRNFGHQGAIQICCGSDFIRVQNAEFIDNLSGINENGLHFQGNGTGIEFLNNRMSGAAWYSIYFWGRFSIFDGNEIFGNGSYGMHIFANAQQSIEGNIVRNNRIHSNGFNDPRGFLGCGLVMANGPNNIAYNNLIYNNGCGIQIDFYCHGCKAYNNTFWGNTGTDVMVYQQSSTVVGAEVRNNIAYSGNQAAFEDLATDTIFSHNLCPFSNFGCAVVGDPQFVNPGGGDFHLQPGSAARDVGTNLSAFFNTDYAGAARNQGGAWDIGAYEFGAGGPGPGPTPTGNPIYLSAGGHGDTPSDGDGSVQSCINAESSATPKATMPGALACMIVPGKELRIRGGTYTTTIDTLTTPITGGNSWLAPTRLTAYQNEPVTLALPVGQTVAVFHRNSATDHYILATGLTIDGMNRTGNNALVFYPGAHHIRYENTTIRNTANGFECVYIGDADNIELKTVTIHTCGTDGVGVQGTVDGLLVETSTIHSTGNRAIWANVASGSNTNLVISRNRIRDTGTAGTMPGIIVGPGTGALVVNNLLYDNDAGIQILSGATETKIYHNTIASTTGVGIQCNSGASGVLVTNNIAFTTGGGILNNCAATLTTNLTTDPLFTNAAGDIYTLQDTSPAINMGTSLPAVTVAFDGVLRPQGPQVDIGAYERSTTTPPVEPTGMGPLVIHAGNPRYFAKPNGDLVFLAGAYDWDFAFRMSDVDAEAYTEFWVDHGMNLIRVTTNDPTFATSSPPGSTPFNSAYFAKLVERVTLAHSKGLYVQISMLEHVTQAPFNDVPYVENYLRHVVDQVGMFENVLFEIGNELQTEGLDGGNVGSFLTQMINVVNAQQAANGFTGASRKPVGISDFPVACGFGVCPAVVSYMKNSPADFIQLGRSEVGQHVDDTPADLAGQRVSIVDSDHIWPYNLNHTWAWRTFMRGHNVQLLDGNEFIPDHSEDDNDIVSVPTFDARMRIGDIRAFALRLDLTQTVPNASVSTTGYALANPGVEYLVYQPGSGPFNVTLLPETYTVEWWDASNQVSVGAPEITATGVTTFTPPFAGDAVLYLKTGPPPPVISPSAAIQALMFF